MMLEKQTEETSETKAKAEESLVGSHADARWLETGCSFATGYTYMRLPRGPPQDIHS